jgi:hypothetical protein
LDWRLPRHGFPRALRAFGHECFFAIETRRSFVFAPHANHARYLLRRLCVRIALGKSVKEVLNAIACLFLDFFSLSSMPADSDLEKAIGI